MAKHLEEGGGRAAPRFGVWFSDQPLSVSEGAKGDTVLALDVPARAIARFEWKEPGKPYREFLVPAAIVNRFGPARVHADDWEGWTAAQVRAWFRRAPAWQRDRLPATWAADKIAFLREHGLLGGRSR